MELAVAANVIEGTMTSSPDFMPIECIEQCKAAVPLLTATEYFAFVTLQIASSNSSILGPVVSQSDLRISTTLFISSSSIVCFP